MDWSLVSKVRRSEIKQKVLTYLEQRGESTPTDISSELEVHRNNVSEHLKFLREEKLVKCLNPNEPHHRYYRITEKGREILEKLQD